MLHRSFCKIASILAICLISILFNILPARSQSVGGLGKITDIGFTPISFPGFIAGPNAKGMVSFDIDGDGRRDAAVLNSIGVDAVTVLRNLSTPAIPYFDDTHVTNLATGKGAEYITYGDIDGDGRQDIVVVNNTDNNISVFRNTSVPGTISFDTAVKFSTVMLAGEPVIEDFDHDGKPDIAIADADARGGYGIGLFLNTSSPGVLSFQPKMDLDIDLASTSTAIGLAAHDLNGDSLPELLYCSYPGDRLYFMMNTSSPGAPSFDSLPSAILKPYPAGTAIGDLDGDGKPDIAVSNSEDSSVCLLRNTTTGGVFSYQQTLLTHAGNGIRNFPGRITIADLNLDGKPDLLVRFSNSTSGGVLQNMGTAPGLFSFAPLEFITLIPDQSGGADPNQEFEADGLAVDDFDGDGKPDLLMTNYRGIYTVFYNTLNLRHNRINEPHVDPSGASPVTDTIAFYTTIDTAVQTYNGSPYLQRHYDIEPVSDPATSTATVTLYYTQQDFDNYNALAAHGDDLPTGPADTADRTHIRLLQYHGGSATHTPGSYPGGTQIIDPDDNKVIWNDTSARWEISFDVTGFSGFFLASSGTVLPLTLISFTGQRQGDNVLLNWTTTDEINVSRFDLQRSTSAGGFATIASIPSAGDRKAHLYVYTDA
ncbi:MAG TPA: VCBS repeat-containing protein, partial [Puia sp.]